MDQTNSTDKKGQQQTTKTRKGLVSIVALLVVAVVVSAILFSTKQDDSAEIDALVNATPAQVDVTDDAFSPATVKIKKGDSVTWTNSGETVHQIASDPHPTHDGLAGLISDEPLQPGDALTYIFAENGTFTYHDESDPIKLQGTVIVE